MLEDNPSKRGIRASNNSPEFLLEFDTADTEFHRGFQCGEIWACLIDGVQEVASIISANNAEMIMRMTDAAGYAFIARPLTFEEAESLELGPGDWMAVLMRQHD